MYYVHLEVYMKRTSVWDYNNKGSLLGRCTSSSQSTGWNTQQYPVPRVLPLRREMHRSLRNCVEW